MAKQLLYDMDARQKLTSGMGRLAKAVSATLGPTGKNVILEKKFSKPVSTKDGVTVSREIELPDPFENMGAKIINEVATRTNDKVGDGTTTAVVLAEAMMREGRKYVTADINPFVIQRGIQKAVYKAVEALRAQAEKVKNYEEVRQVGEIASNFDPSIGKLLADAFEKVGKDGVITLEESKGVDTYLDVVKGLQFDKGYISPYFITKPQTLSVEYENPYIFLHEKKLSNLREFIPVLEKIAVSGKPLVIIAEDVEGELLAALVINKLQGVLKVVAVKAPGFGDRRKALLEDMAVLTGGKLVSEDLGISLEHVDLSYFGGAKKVTVEKEKTTIIEGAGSRKAIDDRIDQINAQMAQTTSTYDKEKLTERKAKLAGGVGILYVGGRTEMEMKERKDRANDALHATRAAVEEGIVAGGGTALIRALEALSDLKAKGEESYGVEVVRKAMEAPLFQIAENCGLDGREVVCEVKNRKGREGFNAMTKEYENLFKAGIIDPVKVTVTALQNAASIAGINLTSDVLITEIKKKAKAESGAVS
ncbi:MAG: chaperonin GroEL [Planctomycetes bacterium]|nr:chaperonin GroEL [Planctomycetota bacterium]